ncbi:hypothetical protein AURDEDRAFT_178191 [Auricularia subglabra TFB-10046 SS5]|uniref:Uncharacterized protein n=1 Tax=Auricularia subglabra (strain TFB-10046 / SS5) TaxID=717982 RepID=J0D270_AURST|nr:hypothetical protein AURDEDRAFT_178191 [Auricularia subglabra TFB-10046 SS5]
MIKAQRRTNPRRKASPAPIAKKASPRRARNVRKSRAAAAALAAEDALDVEMQNADPPNIHGEASGARAQVSQEVQTDMPQTAATPTLDSAQTIEHEGRANRNLELPFTDMDIDPALLELEPATTGPVAGPAAGLQDVHVEVGQVSATQPAADLQDVHVDVGQVSATQPAADLQDVHVDVGQVPATQPPAGLQDVHVDVGQVPATQPAADLQDVHVEASQACDDAGHAGPTFQQHNAGGDVLENPSQLVAQPPAADPDLARAHSPLLHDAESAAVIDPVFTSADSSSYHRVQITLAGGRLDLRIATDRAQVDAAVENNDALSVRAASESNPSHPTTLNLFFAPLHVCKLNLGHGLVRSV